jgi:choline-glycine betaine transporter
MTAQPDAPVRDESATASPLDRHASPVSDRGRSNGRAVAAMVLGIISIPTCFFWPVSVVLGILAIVIGTMAKTDARRGGYENTGQAKAGIYCGIAGIACSILLIVIIAATHSS